MCTARAEPAELQARSPAAGRALKSTTCCCCPGCPGDASLLGLCVALIHPALSMEHPEALTGSQELLSPNPGCSKFGAELQSG